MNQACRPPEDAERLARNRESLLTARAGRRRPERDDKMLADWNGMTIAALAQAAGHSRNQSWLDLARSVSPPCWPI